jgi:ATP-dependent Clp protease protease subunit
MSKFTEQLKAMKDNLAGLVLKFNENPLLNPIAPVALTDHTLADGTVLSIDKVEVGGKATIAGAPADGDFELPDGTKLKIVAGDITEVVMKQEDAPLSEAMFKEHVKKTDAEIAALKATFAEMLGVVQSNFSLTEELSKEPAAKPLEKKIDKPFEQMTALEKRRATKD